MKLYTIIIQPESAFGTPMKGDTIFGHFCWQAAEEELLNGGLERWIACYEDAPFAVFSSAFPVIIEEEETFYAMPRPLLPSTGASAVNPDERYRRLEALKKNRKKRYLFVGQDLKIDLTGPRFRTEEKLFESHLKTLPAETGKNLRLVTGKHRSFSGVFEQPHNTLNRLTNTTGTGQFAPFSTGNIHFLPGSKLAVFILLNEEATDITRVEKGFMKMGQWGFGRDASAGLGRFTVVDTKDMKIPEPGNGARYTLAPCVPPEGSFSLSYFTPFTRFGKHGSALIHKRNPFKNPVLMADEGAIFVLKKPREMERAYMGTAVTRLSKADERTVTQGYSICLPCNIQEYL